MATFDPIDIKPLLTPIEAEQPSGTSLFYQPEYDEVRLARRSEDDGGPQGDWIRRPKAADWNRVVRLGCDLLARKSKDLQVAAWVAEALTRRDGFVGLHAGIRLVREIQDTFWESYFPVLEDGDPESRHGPFDFLDSALPVLIRSLPLTRGSSPEPYSLLKWEESRETDNVGLKSTSAMEALIAEGKITSQQFDDQVAHTPRSFYKTLRGDLVNCRDALDELDRSNDIHFAGRAPGLGHIRQAIGDCLATVELILDARQVENSDDHDDDAEQIERAQRRPAVPQRAEPGAIIDVEDACQRIIEASAYLRRIDPTNPVSYLLVRSLQAGRIFAMADLAEVRLVEAPLSETRRKMLRLADDGDWEELLEHAERALGRPEGVAWLDAHRDALRAMAELGDNFAPARAAARGFLRMLLDAFPDLVEAKLNDGTSAAGDDTRTWLWEKISPMSVATETAQNRDPAEDLTMIVRLGRSCSGGEEQDSDPWDEARGAIAEGRADQGLAIIQRAASCAVTGRDRFIRTLQLAEVCELLNRRGVTSSLAEELARQVDEYRLERWEDPKLCGRAWALLHRCLHAAAGDSGGSERSRWAFARLCRLDIEHALACDGRDAAG